MIARDAHWARKLARLRARQLPEYTLRLCDDMAAKKRFDQAKLEAARLRMADADTGADPAEVERAEVELKEAKAAYEAASLSLAFRALPRPVLDGLIQCCPPTEEQAEDGDA
ncbi:hypothetical protein CP973_36690 [Streptomyces albofaciens JCM 4342]|uniref:hypothetical protein n=1 Tax=Streptomyces albofaciens TaxID=66866 RepID=UPI001238DBA5|nr:hypothetical protein [Streptomyces albofaciens]KAA6214607.1 hypothetical protein CP973_36690 [Streptomyces albofaciens JCM 4342]